MVHRTRLEPILRSTGALLSAALLVGCSTQKVIFTSIPPGATVTAGGKQGVTPCTLKVAKEEGPAVFRLPSGEEMVLPIHGMDSHMEEASEVSGKFLGGTLMVIGGSVVVVGGVAFLGTLILDDDEEDSFLVLASDGEDDNEEILGHSLLVMMGGGAVFALGKWIYPDDAEAALHADFYPAGAAEPEGDTPYEDPGYGARRLKKSMP